MNWINPLIDWLLPAGIIAVVAAVVLWSLRRVIAAGPATRAARQLISIAVIAIAVVALVLALPFADTTSDRLLALFGLVVTAIIALSSTTFVSNAMAGIMLRSVGSFRPGDFIRVGENFGRVTEKGLLHTEIQSEDRDLITLPNLYVMTQPVRVVRASGTLISAEVSLGYDVHRHRVRDLTKAAAADAGLTDPFVQITNLADHAVSYRVYGFLKDVVSLVSKRSELRGKILDRLHGDGVEIVSPGFTNQRRLDPALSLIPTARVERKEDENSHAEHLMFDKAELAARLTDLQAERDELKEKLGTLDGADAESQKREIAWREQQIKHLQNFIDTLESD